MIKPKAHENRSTNGKYLAPEFPRTEPRDGINDSM
jgi:hypothetical protein